MYCDRRGNGQKPTQTKPHGQKPPRTIEIEFVQRTFVQDFVLGLLKSGGPRKCDSLWQREGVKSMWRHAYNILYHTYQTWNLKWFLTFCCNRCILTEEGTDKHHPAQNFPDKIPPDKAPRQKPSQTIEREFVQGAFVRIFVLGLVKIRGVRDVWRTFAGGPGCVTKCDRGQGGQNWLKMAWHTLWTAPLNVSLCSHSEIII